MAQSKPDCHEFLIAATRMMRRKSKGMRPRTAAGVSLTRLATVGLEVYTDAEFQAGLKMAIETNLLILVAWGTSYELDDKGLRTLRPQRDAPDGLTRITSIPTELPNGQYEMWVYDENGKSGDCETATQYDLFQNIMCYVRKDGLPKNISVAIAAGKNKLRAQRIIDSMQKSPSQRV